MTPSTAATRMTTCRFDHQKTRPRAHRSSRSRSIARPKPSLPDSPAKFGFKRIAVIDYDSDGRDDFLEHWQTPTYYVGNGSYQSDSFNWALKPDGQLNLFSTDTVDSIRWLNPDIHRLVPADFTMSADIDGDGHPDLFGGNTSVFYGSGDVSLSRITDGLGKAVDIHYGTSALGGGYQPDARCAADNAPGSSWPEKCLPRMSGIVAGHTEGTIDASGSLVPERTYTYTYVNGRMNLTGHGWLGFDRKIISAVSSAPGDPGTTTTIDYEPVVRYTPGGQVSTHVDKPYLYPFAGLPKITRSINMSRRRAPPTHRFRMGSTSAELRP